MLNVELGC